MLTECGIVVARMMRAFENLRHYYLYFAWIQSLVATFGSLYFSEVMHLVPCTLCWYQRIAMYPLAVILGIAVYRQDSKVRMYAVPLAVIGLLIAVYHNFLYYGMLAESYATCSAGVSCTTKTISWLGFITIPLLSCIAFSVILILVLLFKTRTTKEV